jgi:dUTPase
VKVPIGIELQVEKGFALNISTHPALVAKLGEIFPAFVVVDGSHDHQQLGMPVRNVGRNPIQIMVGDLVACGHVVRVEPVDKEEVEFGQVKTPVPQSKPQRKNPDFKFEMKN